MAMNALLIIELHVGVPDAPPRLDLKMMTNREGSSCNIIFVV